MFLFDVDGISLQDATPDAKGRRGLIFEMDVTGKSAGTMRILFEILLYARVVTKSLSFTNVTIQFFFSATCQTWEIVVIST